MLLLGSCATTNEPNDDDDDLGIELVMPDLTEVQPEIIEYE